MATKEATPVPPKRVPVDPAAASDGVAPRRVDQFKQDIAALEMKTPADASERWWVIGAIVSMVVGFLFILGGYWGASGSAIVSIQIPYLLSGGMLGVGFIVVGAALFVRYSLSRYLRFWLIREIYEQRTQTDRLVESLGSIETLLETATRPRPKSE